MTTTPHIVATMPFNEFMKMWDTFKAAPPDSLTLRVCVIADGAMRVQPVEFACDLLTYSDDTLVVVQRRTGTDTAFAEFTVGKHHATRRN